MRAVNVVIAFALLSFAAASTDLQDVPDGPLIPELILIIVEAIVEFAFKIGIVLGGSWFAAFYVLDFLARETWCKLNVADIGFFDVHKCADALYNKGAWLPLLFDVITGIGSLAIVIPILLEFS
jgi:hypothetical protein